MPSFRNLRQDTIAKAFLVALWCVCFYRAVTQSFVHDEALTYQLYLKGPASEMFHVFSANHHFLNTLLMYLSASVFGVSEWSLRLPALAGAALYFAAIYRISRHAFGAGNEFLLSVALLTLHPFLLDFMVAARGYGMGLALWMWALAVLLPYLDRSKPRALRQLLEAAIALSLSVIANLVFVVPAAILAVLVICLGRPKPVVAPEKKSKRRREKREPSIAIGFMLPIAVLAVLFLMVSPLGSADATNFYTGAASLSDSMRSLARVTFLHRTAWQSGRYVEPIQNAAAFFVGPAILLSALGVAVVRRNLLLLLCSITAVGSAIVLVFFNLAFHLLYPEDRTGIYFLPLTLLALMELAKFLQPRWGAPAYALAAVLVVVFLAQWNVRKFMVWDYDAGTREITDRMAAIATSENRKTARVGASWQLEPSLNFYREKNAWTWMQPVIRNPPRPGFDYYVIGPMDQPAIVSLKLRVLHQDATSGTTLAVP